SGSGSITVDSTGYKQATAQVDVIGIGGVGISAGVAVADVADGADITAQVLDGATVTSSGAVAVTADLITGEQIKATALAQNLTGGLFGSAAIFAAVAGVGGGVKAYLDGTVTSSAQVDVTATADTKADAQLLVISLGG